MPGKPRVAVTMGDPAGVGPEVALKATLMQETGEACIPFLVGNADIWERAASLLGLRVDLPVLRPPRVPEVLPSRPAVIDPTSIDPGTVQPGKTCEAGGRAAYESFMWAIEAAACGRVDAIVTAPLNKASLRMAGVRESGHTDILAGYFRTEDYAMLYYGPTLAVSLATIHIPLREVPRVLTERRVYVTARLTCETLGKIHRRAARVAVLGLNPHAGENGIFGDEEKKIIRPAVKRLEKEGFRVEGPLPPDAAFVPAARARYDGFVAMYHDQGSVPFKMLHFHDGVNHTMGIPIIRTSPDHGTAFDIAWRGKASPESLTAALRFALRLASAPSGPGMQRKREGKNGGEKIESE